MVFLLTILTAFTNGLGFTMLLPLLRVTQSTRNASELSSTEQIIYDFLGWLGISDSLIWILILIITIFIIKGVLRFAQTSYIGYLQADLLKNLKTSFFDLYNGMKYEYYIDQNAGHFINVINAQSKRFFESFKLFANTLTNVVSALSFFSFAIAISWRFAIVVLAVGVGLVYAFQFLNTYVQNLSRRVSGEMSRLNKLLVQSLQAFKYVAATKQGDQMKKEVVASVEALTDDIFRQRMAGAFTKSVRQPVSVLIITSIIAIQALILNEPLTPIFVALILFHKGMQTTMNLQGQWQRVMDRAGSIEVIDEEMSRVRNEQESNGDKIIKDLSDGIDMCNVDFTYKQGDDKVLDGVSMYIPANKTIALVGESGAGKSTIMDLITLILKPQKGSVRIDGVNHDNVDLKTWRSQLGYVSQETVIFDDTIENNICMWKRDDDKESKLRSRVVDAAKRAHAHHFIREMPDGYQTVVGDRGVRLSGGQRQRLFIARELFKKPNVLLLDEATSDLDSKSEKHIQKSIDSLKGEVTVVVIAHRLSTVKNSDQIYMIDNGKVLESGTYKELNSKRKGKFKKMVDMQRV